MNSGSLTPQPTIFNDDIILFEAKHNTAFFLNPMEMTSDFQHGENKHAKSMKAELTNKISFIFPSLYSRLCALVVAQHISAKEELYSKYQIVLNGEM